MADRWPYLWLDVFADQPFAGNQLCVFTAAGAMSRSTMARLTRELGHSETTFLQPPTRPGADARLRILIPTGAGATEVPFAGHPILGSACALAAERREPSTVTFETGVGLIAVNLAPAGDGVWEAMMNQPLPRLVWSRPAPPGLADALGLRPGELIAHLPVEAVDNGLQTVIIPLGSVEAVERCQPDLTRLRELLGRDGLSTLVFATGGLEAESDLHCRVFSPFDLVSEDPATGSANGPLGDYAIRHGVSAKRELVSEQGDRMGRPSRIRIIVDVDGSGATRTIRVAGQVQRVGAGSFTI